MFAKGHPIVEALFEYQAKFIFDGEIDHFTAKTMLVISKMVVLIVIPFETTERSREVFQSPDIYGNFTLARRSVYKLCTEKNKNVIEMCRPTTSFQSLANKTRFDFVFYDLDYIYTHSNVTSGCNYSNLMMLRSGWLNDRPNLAELSACDCFRKSDYNIHDDAGLPSDQESGYSGSSISQPHSQVLSLSTV